MILEIIVLALAILLGVLIYWRESQSNSIFRGYNSFINKKETRMEAKDRKGFFYLRAPQYRILNALLIACVFGVIIYYVPFLRAQILQLSLAFLLGVIIGTYIATALPSVKRAIDNPLQAIQDVGEEAKNIVSDLSKSGNESEKNVQPSDKEDKNEAPKRKEAEVPEEKESARDRMKRKGYL